MSVLESVIGRLRVKKSQAFADDWQAYKTEVLLPLSVGQEIDSDMVDEHLTRLGKNETDLQKDVASLQKRQTLAEQIRQAKTNAAKLATIQSQLEKLDSDFAKVRQKYEADVAPLRSQVGYLSSTCNATQFADDLRRSVQDPNLLKSLAENKQARMEITPRIDWLRLELSRNVNDGLATIRYHISVIENEIASLTSDDSKIKKIGDALLEYATGDRSTTEKKRKLVQAREKLEPLLATRAKYEAELSDLERQLSDLQAEERRLHSLCLEP